MAGRRTDPATRPPRVVVLGGDAAERARLGTGLGRCGVEVTGQAAIGAFRETGLAAMDAVVVILDHAGEAEFQALEALAGERGRVLLFVESVQLHGHGLERVVDKLRGAVVARDRGEPAAKSGIGVGHGEAFPVWVLAASLGGPEMLKRFLRSLDGPPEMAFIIAQHIGEGFTDVLATQLDREAPFDVVGAGDGNVLAPGCAYVAPVTAALDIDAGGCFRLGARGAGVCTPCIDDIMTAAACRFGSRAGAIVFSGMGADGALGCRRIVDAGGTAWAQSFASCVIDNMPREAVASGAVTLQGTPESLALELVARTVRARHGVTRHAQ